MGTPRRSFLINYICNKIYYKMAKRQKVPRTRNNGTMTESMFWGTIRSALRQKSRWFKPNAEAKKRARISYKGPNKRRKWSYICNSCKKHFMDKEVAVDHIVPAGTLRCAEDLPQFVEKLFCEVDGLQVLCKTCHDKKTKKDKEMLKKQRMLKL